MAVVDTSGNEKQIWISKDGFSVACFKRQLLVFLSYSYIKFLQNTPISAFLQYLLRFIVYSIKLRNCVLLFWVEILFVWN